MATVLAYAGLGAAALGLFSVALPLRMLRIRSRRQGAMVAGIGAAFATLALLWPAPPAARVPRPAALMDWYLPEFQFSERHQRIVRAAPDRIFEAIRSVTADDIALFRTLTAIRNPGRLFAKQAEGLLNPSARPILEVARQSGFLLLGEEPGREIVIGALVARPPEGPRLSPQGFAALRTSGYVKAAMNFHVEPRADGTCLLTTETRVFATDPRSARRFAAYWRLVYPGSSLLRHTWLAAIARRAEAVR